MMAGTSGSGKRKHKTLTLPEKWEIIKRHDRGETPTAIFQVYGIGRPTVYDIVKNRENIENFIKTVEDDSKRKTLKMSEHPQVEEALYSWFKQQRNRHAPISGDILKEKAKFFYREITKKDDFRASDGWFENFKKWHGIRFIQMSGEKLSADETDVANFIKSLSTKISELGLTPEQVYNADETGLNWRQLPTKTFVTADEKKVSGRKLQKERITLMVCSNGSGSHKLKLLAVGKSKNPRAFKNTKIENLPVVYMNQSRAWVTQEICHDWFKSNFVKEVKQHLKAKKLPLKALLLLDNAPGHPDSDDLKVKTADGYIEVMYLPKNTTALIQPMDQNVIKTLKAHYKKRLLMDIISQPDADITLLLKQFNIKDAILNAAFAWQQVQSSNVIRSWRNVWPGNPLLPKKDGENQREDETSQVTRNVVEETLTLCNDTNIPQESSEELRRWVLDDNLGADLTDEEIVQEVTSDSQADIIEEAMETKYTVTSDEALSAANTLLRWCEERELDVNSVLILKDIQDKAMTDCMRKKKQKTITDYLNQ